MKFTEAFICGMMVFLSGILLVLTIWIQQEKINTVNTLNTSQQAQAYLLGRASVLENLNMELLSKNCTVTFYNSTTSTFSKELSK